MTTSVYLTVDTESSMGGAWLNPQRRPLPASRHVFCESETGAYGLPLIVGELRRYDFRATFFCEMLATLVLGEDDTRSFTDYLLEAGQDVQLHAHPTYAHYHRATTAGDVGRYRSTHSTSDLLAAHSPEDQAQILLEACEIFRRCVGNPPLAFRAGNFAADRATLRILAELNIFVDSSFNPVYRSDLSFKEDPPEINRLSKINDVWEFPITIAKTRLPEGVGYKPFDLCALSRWEMETILNAAHEQGLEHVTLIFHCFSTVKAKDVYYSQFKPNSVVIGRLRSLLRFLDANRERFAVRTFAEAARTLSTLRAGAGGAMPDLGFWRPALRKGLQAWNGFYWT